MALLAKLQELLIQMDKLKNELIAAGFKPNQTNIREALLETSRRYRKNIDTAVLAIDDTIYNGKYPVPIRTYLPNRDASLPVAIFLHGGGMQCGGITVYDGLVRKLTNMINHIVVAVDYRLSPEFAYPVALGDCKAVVSNIFAVLEERKINYSNRKLVLIGDSAGGGLAATMAMDENFIRKQQIIKQVLFYPSVDYTCTLASIKQFASGYLLEKTKLDYYFACYFQNNEDRKAASPLYNRFYPHMPETLVLVAAYDMLHDEGVLYHDYILKAGGKAKLVAMDSVIHSYLLLEDLCPAECALSYQIVRDFLQN